MIIREVQLNDAESLVNLIKQVEYMMNWELRKDAFRCDGVYIESDKAIIFSLSEAKRM